LDIQKTAMSPKQLKWFFLILLALIWGSSFILIKKALWGLTHTNSVRCG
jgi:drug/metabolite transporter (DMT)-like permease